MSFFKKVFSSVTDVLGLTKTDTPKVDVSTATSTIESGEQSTANAKLKLLRTAGGILGDEVSQVQQNKRNIFGN